MSEWRVGSWFANALLCLIHLLEARPLFIQRAKLYLNPRSEPTIPTYAPSRLYPGKLWYLVEEVLSRHGGLFCLRGMSRNGGLYRV